VSQLREQSRQLAQARSQAADAARAKSDFLASVTDEICAPLDTIVELAPRLAAEGAEPGLAGCLRGSAETLRVAFEDILSFSRAESHDLVPDARPFAFRAFVEEALARLRCSADAKGLAFVVEVEDSVPDALVGDPDRLRQVIVHLADNAVKFTEAGTVRVRVSVAAAIPGEVCLHFQISDTGVGIPQDQQDAVFEPFAHVQTPGNPRRGGLGLGLAMSTRIVKAMRGDLWVESQAGTGTTFRFTVTLGSLAR
jgi:signal transduction histidine kinase